MPPQEEASAALGVLQEDPNILHTEDKEEIEVDPNRRV
jgi:hypothetical protein